MEVKHKVIVLQKFLQAKIISQISSIPRIDFIVEQGNQSAINTFGQPPRIATVGFTKMLTISFNYR